MGKSWYLNCILLVGLCGCGHGTVPTQDAAPRESAATAKPAEVEAAATALVAEAAAPSEAPASSLIAEMFDDSDEYECPYCDKRNSLSVSDDFRQCQECWEVFDTR